MVVIKISCNNDIRRLSFDDVPSWEHLAETVKKIFAPILPTDYLIKYCDDEGDLITVTSEQEFAEALNFAKNSLLRLTVVDTTPAQPEEKKRGHPRCGGRRRHNAFCDHCKQWIVGLRFKCADCPDFDLCETCHAQEKEAQKLQQGNHDASHEFREIGAFQRGGRCGWRRFEGADSCPRFRHHWRRQNGGASPQSPDTPPTHHAICDHCDQRIVGLRYKCLACADFDLCDACHQTERNAQKEKQGKHDASHTFLEILDTERPFAAVRNYLWTARRQGCHRVPLGAMFGARCGFPPCADSKPCADKPAEEASKDETPISVTLNFDSADLLAPAKEETKAEVTPSPVAEVEEKKEEVPQEPEYEYKEQLAQLVAMGFTDEESNKIALNNAHGNPVRAVHHLLGPM